MEIDETIIANVQKKFPNAPSKTVAFVGMMLNNLIFLSY
jgi:hypothetical protein